MIEDGSKLSLELENLQATADHNPFTQVLDFMLPCGPVASIATGEGIPFCLQRVEEEAAKRIVTQFPHVDQDVDFTHAGLLSLDAAFNADADLVITAVFLKPPA